MLSRSFSRLPAIPAPSLTRSLRLMSSTVSPEDPPSALRDVLKAGTRRAAFVFTDGKLVSDTPELQPLADWLESQEDFIEHEAVFMEQGRQTGELMGAFLWRTQRGQGCGGIRLRSFDSVANYLLDGCRLATGMGRKSALAGLWWGGGKGVIAQSGAVSDPEFREALFQDYGDFLTSLQGCYVAAEDSGVFVEDVDRVYQSSRYTTCISASLGGSGNPSVPTALGVKVAIEAALEFQGLSLEGASVAVQGLGNVGNPLIHFLLESGVKSIVGSDVSKKRVDALRDVDPRVEVRLTGPEDHSILLEDVDVVSPNGFGAILNADTIPHIKAKIVCGAANNQLATTDDDKRLQEAAFTYVPDLIANRMGIVNCANEQYGRIGALGTMEDPIITQHLDREWDSGIYQTVRRTLQRANDRGETTNSAAIAIADELAVQPHPIFPQRGAQIAQSLMKSGWKNSA